MTHSRDLAHPHARPRPANVLGYLPRPISHFLGYRTATIDDSSTSWARLPTKPPPQYVVWISSFLGAFCGLSVVQAIFSRAPYFVERGVPPIIASYGASAVLIYGVLEGPLAQPRALVGGHFIGALIGVCISKLFLLLPPSRFADLQWLAASLSCATSIVAMQLTKTTHPPAGATAFLPLIDDGVREMGWYFLPVILLTSAVVGVVALLVNNIQRRWPIFWFTPPPPPMPPVGSRGQSRERSAATTVVGNVLEEVPKGEEKTKKADGRVLVDVV